MNNTEQTTNLEQLQTIEGTKTFFNNIPEECKKNLMDVMKEELELLRKYKIEVREAEWVHDGSDRKDKELSWRTYELDAECLKRIFKNNHVRKPILSQELLDKIESKSLNPKEAEEIVSILKDNCSLWSKTDDLRYWNVNTYGFKLTKYEVDYINSSTFTSFKEVLTRNDM